MSNKTRAEDGEPTPHIFRTVPTWGINSIIGTVAAAFITIYNGQADINKSMAKVDTRLEVLTMSNVQRDKEMAALQAKADEMARRMDSLEKLVTTYTEGNGNAKRR